MIVCIHKIDIGREYQDEKMKAANSENEQKDKEHLEVRRNISFELSCEFHFFFFRQ